jgi:hypothetical protein
VRKRIFSGTLPQFVTPCQRQITPASASPGLTLRYGPAAARKRSLGGRRSCCSTLCRSTMRVYLERAETPRGLTAVTVGAWQRRLRPAGNCDVESTPSPFVGRKGPSPMSVPTLLSRERRRQFVPRNLSGNSLDQWRLFVLQPSALILIGDDDCGLGARTLGEARPGRGLWLIAHVGF